MLSVMIAVLVSFLFGFETDIISRTTGILPGVVVNNDRRSPSKNPFIKK
jgi:hypothetical protein